MKTYRIFGLVIVALLLSSCNQATGNGSLDISERSNEVAETNLNLGIAYLKRGEYEKSLEKLNKALEHLIVFIHSLIIMIICIIQIHITY